MYAVILTGGKQHQVAVGDELAVELLADAEVGKSVDFDKVLMVADGDNVKVGAPYLENGKVVVFLCFGYTFGVLWCIQETLVDR